MANNLDFKPRKKIKWIEAAPCPYCGNFYIPTKKSPNACLVKFCRDKRK